MKALMIFLAQPAHRKLAKKFLLWIGVALLAGDFVIAIAALIPLEAWAHPMGATGAITTAIADAIEA